MRTTTNTSGMKCTRCKRLPLRGAWISKKAFSKPHMVVVNHCGSHLRSNLAAVLRFRPTARPLQASCASAEELPRLLGVQACACWRLHCQPTLLCLQSAAPAAAAVAHTQVAAVRVPRPGHPHLRPA